MFHFVCNLIEILFHITVLQKNSKPYFLTVAQIEKITDEETEPELTAPFEATLFENLDLKDFDILFAGGEFFRQPFSRSRETAAGIGDRRNQFVMMKEMGMSKREVEALPL